MPINMDIESSAYWEEATPSIPESEYPRKIDPMRTIGSASPLPQSFYSHICKEENSVYPYCDRSFNFSANPTCGGTSEDDEYHHPSPKRKITVTRDPMSHRIIEKRRRDRMNNCLADLSKLIPAEYLKKGRGRIEKTEIIEMAIKHMKYLQTLTCTTVEPGDGVRPGGIINDKQFVNGAKVSVEPELSPQEHYKLGYQECVAETMRFLVERQGFFSTDPLCVKMISHLQKYYEKLTKGDKLVSNALEHLSPTDLEPKMNDYHSSSISEMSDRNAPNSVMAAVHSDDSCHENGSMNDSQLREMLVSPRLSTIYIPTVRPNVVRHPSPEPSSPQNDSTNDNHSSNGSLYKFKNNIRERFEHSNPDKGSPPMMVYGTKRRANSMEPLHSPSAHDHYPSVSRPVPIFALHSNGSFYVPLTIDSHLLSPFVADLNGDYDLHGFSPLLLHPVTISVNFNRPPVQSSPLLPSLSFASRLQNGPLLMVPECR